MEFSAASTPRIFCNSRKCSGLVLPINEIVTWSHDAGAKVLVDACQSVLHMVVDVKKLEAEFFVASSHKMCGPTGIGFLYGNNKILSAMPPYLGGGEMIADVFQDYSTFAEPPSRFEAGTPAIVEARLGAATDYLTSIGMQKIHDYEKELANYLYHSLLSVPNVCIYGPPPTQAVHRSPLCSFTVENIPSKAIATHLIEKTKMPHEDSRQSGLSESLSCQHVCLSLQSQINAVLIGQSRHLQTCCKCHCRTVVKPHLSGQELHVAIGLGHHCAQPLHHYLGIEASKPSLL